MNFDNKNKKLKPFLFSFGIFLLVLICFSFFMFMNSIDYDFDNLFEGNSTVSPENEIKPEEVKYSVSTLKGKSSVMFAVLNDEKEVEMAFFVITDFDNKTMQVEFIDDSVALTSLYKEKAEIGIKDYISSNYNIDINKYAVFTKHQFKNVLSLFSGITINVPAPINHKSQEYNLLLDSGKQAVSGEIAYKYLMICDNNTRESAICDIINSILTTEYLLKSDSLFKSFVNLCITDISIIDYSNSIEVLNVYVNAKDKFLPKPYIIGE